MQRGRVQRVVQCDISYICQFIKVPLMDCNEGAATGVIAVNHLSKLQLEKTLKGVEYPETGHRTVDR